MWELHSVFSPQLFLTRYPHIPNLQETQSPYGSILVVGDEPRHLSLTLCVPPHNTTLTHAQLKQMSALTPAALRSSRLSAVCDPVNIFTKANTGFVTRVSVKSWRCYQLQKHVEWLTFSVVFLLVFSLCFLICVLLSGHVNTERQERSNLHATALLLPTAGILSAAIHSSLWFIFKKFSSPEAIIGPLNKNLQSKKWFLLVSSFQPCQCVLLAFLFTRRNFEQKKAGIMAEDLWLVFVIDQTLQKGKVKQSGRVRSRYRDQSWKFAGASVNTLHNPAQDKGTVATTNQALWNHYL